MLVIVAYATAEQQVELPINVAANTTVAKAITASGVLKLFPEMNANDLSVGIFSEKVDLQHLLQENDRVEIYRPLQIDPKQARRLRASIREHKQRKR